MALANCHTVLGQDGRELKEHGSVLFPIAGYYDDLRLEAVPWHWHEELEVAVVVAGEAELLLEKKTYQLKKGDGFFINAQALHGVNALTPQGCQLYSLVFHPRLVGGSGDSVFWQNYVGPLMEKKSFRDAIFDGSVSWHNKACDFIKEAWQAMAEEPVGYEFQVRHALSQLILLLKLHMPVSEREPSERDLRNAQRIRVMLQYIEMHYKEEISTAQIAGSALISERECLRCFHKSIGMPPVRYLKQFRIQKASELLLSTEKSAGDIGAECGFLDNSYFTKAFREIKGCTPGAYRSRRGA